MKVLVIGGNRYFGKRLVRLLADDGHDVTVANRGSKPGLFRGPIKTVRVDRSDLAGMAAVFAKTSWDIIYDQVCNTAEEAEVVKAVFEDRVGKLVFTSTASVYPTAPDRDESFFDPKSFNDTDHSEHDYQHGKRLAEKAYLTAKFPVIAVRIPVVVGVDDCTMRMHWHVERVMKGEPIYFPDIRACYSFISSEDAASFLAWLMLNQSLHGAVNACSPDPIRLADFMHQIEHHCKRDAVYADAPSDSNHSPYGVSSDSYLSMAKAKKHGYEFPLASDWFPKLVQHLCHDYANWVGK